MENTCESNAVLKAETTEAERKAYESHGHPGTSTT